MTWRARPAGPFISIPRWVGLRLRRRAGHVQADYRGAFLWLVAATFIDATDGMLARAAASRRRRPGFDGARLDDIVDYLTFVFVPHADLYRAGDLPEGWGLAVAAVVLLSSAYGFASLDAKTDDYFFTGFPSYWNIVALYIHAGGRRRRSTPRSFWC